ncbi:alpha-hydroxy acid oxidase [Oricola indica]|jgi:L-lactate dehydrogenase (cytochrome)|uniref:alpha-hydroxy acid oxidase n=1 Tax=Oricola indica TaxID=2872591 RepID=UPI001CC0FC80|nr:alpha-hydroxy acid oxidase [Oricola indica]
MRLDQALTIADLKDMARARVPRMFFDYADSGSWTEGTYRANSDDLGSILFEQRVAVDLSNRTTRSEMAGRDVSMPVALAPTGLTGMQHADGEILGARAAARFGVPFTLSTMSICSIEAVAAATDAPFWFQLYVMRDLDFVDNLIERADAAGCDALVLTLDLQILGQRHKDIRNGLGAPPKLGLSSFLQMASRPRWCVDMLRTRNRSFGNIVGHAKNVSDLSSLSSWTAEQFDPELNWGKIARIRNKWPRKLILKGIMNADDARMAAENGADAIVVSNHGGRQLDGAPSSISVLQSIVDAVGDRVEVHFDGGISSGQDVLRALALGAKGTYIGRSWLYGLGAGGEAGVRRALEIIRNELDLTMAFCGERDIRNVGRHILHSVAEQAA